MTFWHTFFSLGPFTNMNPQANFNKENTLDYEGDVGKSQEDI